MRLAIDPYEDFVQVPTPLRIRSSLNAMFSDLVGEHRTEATPPEPYRLVADVDAALEQNILDLPQRQRMYIITVRRITSGELLK